MPHNVVYSPSIIYYVCVCSLSLAVVECYSEQEVAGIVRQIVEALQYLHGNDLVHQDLKVGWTHEL